jgi:hypothetical protein
MRRGVISSQHRKDLAEATFIVNAQEPSRQPPIYGYGSVATDLITHSSTEQKYEDETYLFFYNDDYQLQAYDRRYGKARAPAPPRRNTHPRHPTQQEQALVTNSPAPEGPKPYDAGALANYAPGAQDDKRYNSGQHLRRRSYPQQVKPPVAASSVATAYVPGSLANYAPNAPWNTAGREMYSQSTGHMHGGRYRRLDMAPSEPVVNN